VAAAAAWALFLSPWLVVRAVVVTGNRLVSRSEVLAAARVDPGTPLIRVNTGQVAARVGTITQVAGVGVARSWPDKLVITVRERTPAMAVTLPSGGYDLVDAHGVLVRWAARRPAGLPLFSAAADVTSPRGNPDIAAAAAVLAELPAELRQSVRSVTAPGPSQVTLHLAHGVTVLWGSPGQAAVKTEELKAVMHTHAAYYDVSEPGTVTTKLRGLTARLTNPRHADRFARG
jgi:cell division septal protein FtsQ